MVYIYIGEATRFASGDSAGVLCVHSNRRPFPMLWKCDASELHIGKEILSRHITTDDKDKDSILNVYKFPFTNLPSSSSPAHPSKTATQLNCTPPPSPPHSLSSNSSPSSNTTQQTLPTNGLAIRYIFPIDDVYYIYYFIFEVKFKNNFFF
jgi:hypothetical protein